MVYVLENLVRLTLTLNTLIVCVHHFSNLSVSSHYSWWQSSPVTGYPTQFVRPEVGAGPRLELTSCGLDPARSDGRRRDDEKKVEKRPDQRVHPK